MEKENKLHDIHRKLHKDKIVYTRTTCNSATRIDRIYVNKNLLPRTIDSSHIRNSFSDHNLCPIIKISIELKRKWGHSYYKINDAILKHQDLQCIIHTNWINWRLQKLSTANMLEWWEKAKLMIKNECMEFSKYISRIERNRYIYSIQKLSDIKDSDENYKNNKEYINLQNNVNRYENKINQGALIRAKVISFDNEEQPTKNFFQFEKAAQSRCSIYTIQNEQGVITDNKTEIIDIIHAFYTNLWGKDNKTQAQQNYLDEIEPITWDHDETNYLNQPITERGNKSGHYLS